MVVPGTCHPGVAAGMAALQMFYNASTGLWNTAEWWHAANALETTIDYALVTKAPTYQSNIFNTFEKNKQGNFLNRWFYDDDGWWALAWIKAYDLTGETRYLEMAKTIFNSMKQGWDSTCGGGVWWKKERTYKNAITNELFITVAARLHLRTPGDGGTGSYLDWAKRGWTWFKNTDMINSRHLVNDGLNDACRNNQKTTWTYNQGVILGGLVDLFKATKDSALLVQAERIADAAIRDLAPNGILREPCGSDCGADGPRFKGIFMRNLAYLYQTTKNPAYKAFIVKNANSVWSRSRNDSNHFGLDWAGPFDSADAVRQSSALDAIIAAIAVGTQGITYQAEDEVFKGVSAAKTNPGYTGAGYVKADPHDDHSITFNVGVACSGQYNLTFRYAAAEGDASRYVYVNGREVVDNQLFPATENWSSWNTVTVPKVWLNVDRPNAISLIFNTSKGSQHDLNLDEMTID